MFKDSRGIGGGFAVKREENGCGSDEHEEHGECSHTQQEVKDSFAHTGDRTGSTQPHREFRQGEFLSPEGGIELQGEALINLVHGSHTKDLYTHGGAISQGLVLLKEDKSQ